MRVVRWILAVVGVVGIVVSIAALWLYGRVRSVESEHVTGDVSVVYGLGSNVGVLKTSAGAVVVDTMAFPTQGRRVREVAEHIGGGPVQAILNTHYHSNHTHGNPGFASGTTIVATARTKEHLLHRDAAYWAGERDQALPSVTFDTSHELRIGGKTIRSHFFGRGHTDGDLVVLFVEDRVLHAGDLCFNGLYPAVDLEAGGSVRNWSETLASVLALDFDKVIPGHGPQTDRAGLVRFQRLMAEAARLAETAATNGEALESFQRAAPLRADDGFVPMTIPFVLRLDRELLLRRAWEEATGAVRANGE